VVRKMSTRKIPRHAEHKLGRPEGWRWSTPRSAGGAFLRWDAELWKNYKEVR
jgi:hypothetical protein